MKGDRYATEGYSTYSLGQKAGSSGGGSFGGGSFGGGSHLPVSPLGTHWSLPGHFSMADGLSFASQHCHVGGCEEEGISTLDDWLVC